MIAAAAVPGLLASSLMILGTAAAMAQPADDPAQHQARSAVTAINVLLEPDSHMAQRARALNERLRANYPHGFALDATHAPHISLLHRFVRTGELDKVYVAIARVLANTHPSQWELTASGYDVAPWEGQAMVSIKVERTSALSSLQDALVKAVGPYTADAGDASAFVTAPGSRDIGAATIDYVRTFVPKRLGENFKPHITVGLSTEEFAKRLQAEPFEPAVFKVSGVAVYQLGDAGTARRKLWTP